MILAQRQQQVLSQKMVMSQQMLSAVALLNLSSEDFQEEIAKEVKRNPALVFKNSYKIHASDVEAGDRHQSFLESLKDESYKTLQENLLQQARETIKDEYVLDAAVLIIQNIDKNGFNSVSINELFDELLKEKKITKIEIKKALKAIHRMEPIGCACNNLKQSLVIQAGILCESPKTGNILDIYKLSYATTVKIIKEHYEVLATINNIPNFEQKLKQRKINITTEEAEEVAELIKTLTPYPGRTVSNNAEKQNFITPVAEIKRDGDYFKVIINDEEIPAIEISSEYQNQQKSISKEEKQKIIDLVNRAKMFMSVLSFRNQTILKILTAIVNYQQSFFVGRTCKITNKHCPGYLKPLKQADIADMVNLSISTISRIANQKYIRCEWGILEIKDLFSNSVTNGLSKDYAISKMKEVISEKIKTKEKISDSKISKILKHYGIEISTRTVNKYRKELSIPSSYYRN